MHRKFGPGWHAEEQLSFLSRPVQTRELDGQRPTHAGIIFFAARKKQEQDSDTQLRRDPSKHSG